MGTDWKHTKYQNENKIIFFLFLKNYGKQTITATKKLCLKNFKNADKSIFFILFFHIEKPYNKLNIKNFIDNNKKWFRKPKLQKKKQKTQN